VLGYFEAIGPRTEIASSDIDKGTDVDQSIRAGETLIVTERFDGTPPPRAVVEMRRPASEQGVPNEQHDFDTSRFPRPPVVCTGPPLSRNPETPKPLAGPPLPCGTRVTSVRGTQEMLAHCPPNGEAKIPRTWKHGLRWPVVRRRRRQHGEVLSLGTIHSSSVCGVARERGPPLRCIDSMRDRSISTNSPNASTVTRPSWTSCP
jgi:hypothetical protein